MAQKVRIVVGSVTAAAALATGALIKPWEGRKYVASPDIGGVIDVCDGHTGPDIIPGKVYTDDECNAITAKDVAKAEQNVRRGLSRPVPIETMAAFISFEFNTGGFLKSTMRKLANAGDLRGACNQLSRWVYVKGVIIRGLVNRRVAGDSKRLSERTVCLAGIGVKPIWYDSFLARFIIWQH